MLPHKLPVMPKQCQHPHNHEFLDSIWGRCKIVKQIRTIFLSIFKIKWKNSLQENLHTEIKSLELNQ